MNAQKGFTLIELMIVIAIIGILAAIAIPAYNDYIKKSHDTACLSEVKGYANQVYTNAIDPTGGAASFPTYTGVNCTSVTEATAANAGTMALLETLDITATPKDGTPGKTVTCDMAQGATCALS